MRHEFATCTNPLVPIGRARTFFDGVFSEPRLQHPEGVAIGPDGWIWCSSENGQILRIAPDGGQIQEVATTNGFTLGIAFDGDRALYACDSKHAAVFRYDLLSGKLAKFSSPGIRLPNYPIIDPRRRRLLVSESFEAGTPGPGIWSYELDTGKGSLWYDESMDFANGLALGLDGDRIYVCETFARRILCIEIEENGAAGHSRVFADDLAGLPDGLALDKHGNVFVGCYEPSRILRISADGRRTDIYVDDPTAHVMCHPTNIAFKGSTLYTANLGRWHITEIKTDTSADPLCHSNRPVQTDTS